MEYFLSHLPYIIVIGLVIAGLAAIYAFVGAKNNRERDFNDERCEYNCGTCANYDICNKDGKIKGLMKNDTPTECH